MDLDLDLDADVIVVGAGVSGLEAARHLERAGYGTIVIEARARVGGRIETHRLAGWPAPVEAGAEFVHGRPPLLLRGLAAARARLVEVRASHALAAHGHVRAGGRVWRQAQAWMDRVPDEDVPFDRVLTRPDFRKGLGPEARQVLRGFVESFNAADAARVSARGLRRQTRASEAEHGDRMFRVRNGYDVLPESLARPVAARGRLFLGLAVTAIRRRAAGVEVVTRSPLGGPTTTLRGRAALVTLPLAVLQARRGTPHAVEFIPELPPAKRNAVSGLAMGRVIKVIVRFRGPLRRGPHGAGFLHLPRAAVPTWWVPVPAPPSCLVGWVAGPAAERFAARHTSSGERITAALRVLARGLGSEPGLLARFVEDAQVFDWGADPWARGAYSWIPTGAVGLPGALAAPVDDRLFFAGEATDTSGDGGTVHGALATGARAAAEIVARLPRSASSRLGADQRRHAVRRAPDGLLPGRP